MIRKWWRFLGSIWFAVPLFVGALVLVMAGTFIEGAAGSHEAAANWIYGTVYFNILLSLFFVNILVSALHRWPFHARHVPFLLTHLGLLMVIGGTMTKNLFGLQGHMVLTEGRGSHSLFITGSESLVLRTLDTTETFPLDRSRPSGFAKGPHQLVAYAKSCESHLEGFIKKEGVKLFGQPFLPKQPLEGFKTTPLKLGDQVWESACIQTDDIEGALKGRQKSLLFIDSIERQTLVALGPLGEPTFLPIGPVESYNAYGKGFGGYSVEAQIDQGIAIEAPMTERIVQHPEGRPALVVELDNHERVALAYDPTGGGLQWPVKGGTTLARFEPESVEIPQHIRLLRAHKEFYPGTSQVQSYTAAILATDLDRKTTTPFTLEMNRVYESYDGYRFYLSNLIGEEGERKSVQLTVNYDPVRYSVTYPGALILAIGMILLFLPKKKRS